MADRYQSRAHSQDQYAGQAPQQSSGGDPLAELARLIGQADPNSNFGREARGPAPSRDTSFSHHPDDTYAVTDDNDSPPPGPPSWMQRVREQQSHDQPHYADEAAYQSHDHGDAHQADPARYDDVLYGQGHVAQIAYDQNQYGQYAPPLQLGEGGYDEEPEQKPRRGGLLTVAMVLALGVVGTAGAFAYRSFTGPRSGEPPVIKADTGPTKIVPPTNQTADASGKLIYDRIGAGGAERVVPREEQPLDVKTGAGTRVVLPPMGQQSANAAQAALQPGARGAAAPQGEEPRKVRTLSIRPDQPEAAPVAPPAKQPARTQAPQTANASTGNGPVSLSPPGQQAAPVRTASTAPIAGPGAFVVQVSSQRSEADAQSSYRALQGKYPSVLGSRQAAIRKADLGDKGVYYRAIVGPFGSSDEATRLCESLKSAGGQCNVMRN